MKDWLKLNGHRFACLVLLGVGALWIGSGAVIMGLAGEIGGMWVGLGISAFCTAVFFIKLKAE